MHPLPRLNVWRVDPQRTGDVHGAAAGIECALAPEGRAFHAYNQEAFHYFLALERTRAERSRRSVVLVLASTLRRAGVRRPMDSSSAQKLFAGLWLCTRDADFIGWYREGRIAGAVLAQRSEHQSGNVCRRIRARVLDVLFGALPKSTRAMLRVHVVQLLPKAQTS